MSTFSIAKRDPSIGAGFFFLTSPPISTHLPSLVTLVFLRGLFCQFFATNSILSPVRPIILLDFIMATPKDRGGEYKSVPLEEQDAVELRKAVATGSVKEPFISSASA